ncbi:MAG TPA: hypothetical protein VN706_10955 [Gemmatimonadaceae bacterium]|nr:hypothetical protein [Gemmatimonadaceae bacterium]
MELHEAHAERLLGTKVRDVNGEVLGRLEEMIVEVIDGEPVVTEFHVGPVALLERIGGFLEHMPYFRLLPFPKWEYRIPWTDVELGEVGRVTVKVAKERLRRVEE